MVHVHSISDVIPLFCRNTGSDKIFPQMASDSGSRSKFIESAIQFAKRYGFQGIDLDWEYPNWENKSE